MKFNHLSYSVLLNATCKVATCLLVLASFNTNHSMVSRKKPFGSGAKSSFVPSRKAELDILLADPLVAYNSCPTASQPACRYPEDLAKNIHTKLTSYELYLARKYAPHRGYFPDERVSKNLEKYPLK